MSRKAKHNNQTTPENVLAFENVQRQKRIDALDRLARMAWEAGDENASIRFRYEWWAAQCAMDEPVEELREWLQQRCGTDHEWEKINLWRAAYDAHEYVRQHYENKEKNGNG